MTRSIVLRSLMLALLWWILVEGRSDSWYLGAFGVAAGVAASLLLLPVGGRRLRASALPGFIAFFLWNSMRGGAQVAALALRRRPDLRPAVLDVFLALPEGAPRLLMLNAIAMMPGTVAVRLDDARLTLHVLDARLPAAAEASALEAHIARLFSVAP